MVRDGEDAIKAIGGREFNNKVHGNIFKQEGGVVGNDRVVWCAGASCDGFGGLASGATADEGGNEILHVGPPVVLSKEKTDFQDAGVTHCGGVMI